MTKLFATAVFAATLFASGNTFAADGISSAEAVAIATQNGMTAIDEVERDDGRWEIEGETANGNELELEIHARTGAILDRDD